MARHTHARRGRARSHLHTNSPFVERTVDAALVTLYFVPLAVLLAVGPRLMLSRGARALTVLVITSSVAAATPLAIIGGVHRQNEANGGFEPLALVFTSAFFCLLLVGPAVALGVLSHRQASARRQRTVAFAIGMTLHVAAGLFYLLAVGCILTGECVQLCTVYREA
jgi:hypothetical protein